jgi:uncharacterized protein (DUF302 family)
MIRKVEIERFSLISSRPFDQVVAAVDAGIGHPDMAEFGRSTHEARSLAELKSAVEKGLSKVGLMLFMKLDYGAVVRKDTGRDMPRIIRFIIGNPLIMMEMAKHVPDAGSYAPVTVLVDERLDGVHLSYDRMSSLLAPYGNRDALKVARDLDKRVEDLLRQAIDRIGTERGAHGQESIKKQNSRTNHGCLRDAGHVQHWKTDLQRPTNESLARGTSEILSCPRFAGQEAGESFHSRVSKI